MESKLTEIEKIYIEKVNINIESMSLIERLETRKKAYEWAYKMREKYEGDVENNKEKFLNFLKGLEIQY